MSALYRANLFELQNARTMSLDQVVSTFVPVQTFWRLLSAKHHVLIGSRGSGKTAIAKMLSHDHLSRLQDVRAIRIIQSKAFIGIYVPTKLKWVSALQNKPWQTDEEKERFFQWRFNLATCLGYLRAIRSCLDVYLDDKGTRARAEEALVLELSKAWAEPSESCSTVRELECHLEDIEHMKQQELARARAANMSMGAARNIGTNFDMELLEPLQRGLTVASRVLGFSGDTSWLLCIDEAEFLDRLHLQILNSHMRAHSGNLFFKITTMPYRYTPDSINPVPLEPGHDFDYAFLDADTAFQERDAGESNLIGTQFARRLFEKRAGASGLSYAKVTLSRLLGRSELLDSLAADWSSRSDNMRLLKLYGSNETIERAKKLAGTRKFNSEMGRKIHGALLLRHKLALLHGKQKLDAYSGATMVMRCGDANPRRLINIFNALLLGATWRKDRQLKEHQSLSKKRQTEILTKYSQQLLAAVQSEPRFQPEPVSEGNAQFGNDLYQFINMIGEYLRNAFIGKPLSTDQISSIEIDRSLSEEEWTLIRWAVSLGLLYPQINPNNPDELPIRTGTFHLAYALAPLYRTMPRRGKARSLASIRKWWYSRQDRLSGGQGLLFPDVDGGSAHD